MRSEQSMSKHTLGFFTHIKQRHWPLCFSLFISHWLSRAERLGCKPFIPSSWFEDSSIHTTQITKLWFQSRLHCLLSTHNLLYHCPNNHNINNKMTMLNYKEFTFMWETKTVYIYQHKIFIRKDERDSWVCVFHEGSVRIKLFIIQLNASTVPEESMRLLLDMSPALASVSTLGSGMLQLPPLGFQTYSPHLLHFHHQNMVIASMST